MEPQPTERKGFLIRLISRSRLPLWPTRSYQELSQEKGHEMLDQQTEVRNGRHKNEPDIQVRSRYRYIICGVILLLLLLPIPIFFVDRAHPRWKSCGNNPRTARERGCSFDLITFAWQLPKCYDSSLVEEFAAREPWKFYTDEHGNDTVSLEEARKGETHLWLTWRYHKAHCAFVWRQQHRAYETGWIDQHARTYRHTMHCHNILLSDCHDEGRLCILSNDTIVTEADMIYPACEKVNKGYQSVWDGFSARYH